MNALTRSVPAPATLSALRCDSARRGQRSIPYLCAASAEIERQLTKIYEPTGDMSYADERDYLERVDPVMSGLNDEQCRLVDTLAAQPIATMAAAADIARLALMLSEIDGSGLFAPYGSEMLFYRVAAFVASGSVDPSLHRR
jgi:hypothetical protein